MGASTTARPGYFARISALFRWCWGSVLVRFWDTGNALVTRRFVTRRFTARISVEIGLRAVGQALSGRRCRAGVVGQALSGRRCRAGVVRRVL